jgi:hypothetical protein
VSPALSRLHILRLDLLRDACVWVLSILMTWICRVAVGMAIRLVDSSCNCMTLWGMVGTGKMHGDDGDRVGIETLF